MDGKVNMDQDFNPINMDQDFNPNANTNINSKWMEKSNWMKNGISKVSLKVDRVKGQ